MYVDAEVIPQPFASALLGSEKELNRENLGKGNRSMMIQQPGF